MSHIPQRTEKDCLNCGTIVQGKYCHVCGQENVLPKETFWHMVTHFFYDITHFDGKFFVTLKDLLLRPGFLTKEYIAGRRATYLHPVRMYVFTSAVFFLLFFSLFKPEESIKVNINDNLSPAQRATYIARLEKKLKENSSDSIVLAALGIAKDSSRVLTSKDILQGTNNFISFAGRNYNSEEEYDSLQKLLPAAQRDGWVARRFVKKGIDINNRYRNNKREGILKLAESILHRLPYLLFVSLPLFALLLRLVYIRRKQFYFADHGVFTIHLYIFTFITLMAVFGSVKLHDVTGWGFFNFLTGILFLLPLFYLYKAMRNFYQQKRFKTFTKFLFVSFWALIMVIVLLAIFMFFSAVTL